MLPFLFLSCHSGALPIHSGLSLGTQSTPEALASLEVQGRLQALSLPWQRAAAEVWRNGKGKAMGVQSTVKRCKDTEEATEDRN